MGIHGFRTYEIDAPLATHHREITCEEAQCAAWRNGWVTIIERPNRELSARRIRYIRERSGRRFTMQAGDGVVTFTFPPGQTCFQPHYVLDREPVYRRFDDSSLSGITHARADHWVEDFAEHQDRIARTFQRG